MNGEVSKAHARRVREGWYEKFCPADAIGIDIGCQHDPIHPGYRKYDIIFGDGDATFMEGVPDDSYEVVHASHILEHLDDPITALRNWWRILKPGGHLIVLVPHQHLYERKEMPPSNWNHEHRTFWVPHGRPASERVHGRWAFLPTLSEVVPPHPQTHISFRILDEGWEFVPPDVHARGEYSIEAILRKPRADDSKVDRLSGALDRLLMGDGLGTFDTASDAQDGGNRESVIMAQSDPKVPTDAAGLESAAGEDDLEDLGEDER